eukprot:TRINITY_DN5100_c0_g1_i1.p1 TRINITY_DN5100_c0_g1~~TRINITY_DN5100_c0_g1_i1.p1  ORF type:complete len:637 (-),score=240.99 TRINITY_DN5100_c0_g1_i1:72-1982(-)
MSDADRKKLLEEGRKRFQKMKNTKKKQAQAGQKAANNGGFSIEEEPISKPEENNNPADINGSSSTSSSYEYNNSPTATYTPPIIDTRPTIDYEALLRAKDEEVTKAQQEVKTVKGEMKKQQTRMSILEQTNKILLQEKDAFDQTKRKLTQEVDDLKNKLAEKSRRVSELEAQANRSNSLQGDLDKERNNFAQEKQKLNQDNANLRELVTKMQKSIDTLRQEKNELEQQKAVQREEIEKLNKVSNTSAQKADENSTATKKREEQLKKKEDELKAKEEVIKKQEEQLKEKQNTVVQNETLLRNRETVHRDREVALKKREDNVAKLEQQYASQQQGSRTQDTQLKEREEALRKREETLRLREEAAAANQNKPAVPPTMPSGDTPLVGQLRAQLTQQEQISAKLKEQYHQLQAQNLQLQQRLVQTSNSSATSTPTSTPTKTNESKPQTPGPNTPQQSSTGRADSLSGEELRARLQKQTQYAAQLENQLASQRKRLEQLILTTDKVVAQKSVLLEQLANEVRRNGVLVKRNAELYESLQLQKQVVLNNGMTSDPRLMSPAARPGPSNTPGKLNLPPPPLDGPSTPVNPKARAQYLANSANTPQSPYIERSNSGGWLSGIPIVGRILSPARTPTKKNVQVVV